MFPSPTSIFLKDGYKRSRKAPVEINIVNKINYKTRIAQRFLTNCGVLFLLFSSIFPAFLYLSYLPTNVRSLVRNRVFIDDAFYYYQVAWNLLSGRGMTFDGINLSNGFQPLWLVVSLFLVDLHHKDKLLGHVLLVEAILVAGGLFFLAIACIRRKVNCFLAALAVVCLGSCPYFIHYNFIGLETSLYTFMWGLTLLAFVNVESKGYQDRVAVCLLGLSAALLNLSRTDSLIFTALCGISILYRFGIRATALYCVPLVILVGPYLASNLYFFGELMPISGAVKRAYSLQVLANQSAALQTPEWNLKLQNLLWPTKNPDYYWIIVAFVLNALGTVYLASRREIAFAIFTLFLVVKYFVYALLYFHHSEYLWYYVSDLMGATVVVLVLGRDLVVLLSCQRRAQIFRPLGWLISAAMAFIFIQKSVYWQDDQRGYWGNLNSSFSPKSPPNSEVDLFYLAAQDLKKVPALKRFVFGMHNAGIFAYFSSLSVVNLDGLINGRDRLEYIRRFGYGFAEYLDEKQPIDAYLDFIHTEAKSSYDAIFLTRAFSEFPLQERLDRRYGAAPGANASGMITMYVKPAVRMALQR